MQLEFRLEGKNAYVGGASKGIGRAVSIALAAQGANVVAVSRSKDLLKQLVDDLPRKGDQDHRFFIADYANPQEVSDQMKHILKDDPIHILINNTGGPPAGPVNEAEIEEFTRAITLHLYCNHLLTQAVLPVMKREGFGRIINIISTSVKEPIPGLGVSNTTRGAVASWAKTLSREVASYGITVNNVLPGFTKTGRLEEIIDDQAEKQNISPDEVKEDMYTRVPAGRFGEPEEIAAAVTFLASPAASYVNGINLPVDGGRTLCL